MKMHWCVKLALSFSPLSISLSAQDAKAALDATIRHEDAIFWDAYNRCDVPKMSEFFWPDIEFYHDKGGLTVGLGPFVEALKTGLCGKPTFRLRREGIAKFFHVWLVKDGTWKMARVISYDHRDAPYENARKEVMFPPELLDQYAGKYDAPKNGSITVVRNNRRSAVMAELLE